MNLTKENDMVDVPTLVADLNGLYSLIDCIQSKLFEMKEWGNVDEITVDTVYNSFQFAMQQINVIKHDLYDAQKYSDTDFLLLLFQKRYNSYKRLEHPAPYQIKMTEHYSNIVTELETIVKLRRDFIAKTKQVENRESESQF